ncbi:MAG: 23S rRNA (guanosine(2251)-2'-O)-methyltransferase RlmB [Bacteroidota bacterium]
MKHQDPSGSKRMIYGLHPVEEALQAGQAIEKILLKKEGNVNRFDEIRQGARNQQVPVQMVPEAKLRRMLPQANHQGVVALMSPVQFHELEDIILDLQERERNPLMLMLDGISDVRNFGAIVRTAECLGAHALVIPTQRSAALNADAIKVSAGALYHLPICRSGHLADAILLLQAYGIQCVACTEKAGASIFEVNFSGPTCLILGSEDKGISNSLLKKANYSVKIPLQGQVNSLNVSVAAGMFMLEVARQRDH